MRDCHVFLVVFLSVFCLAFDILRVCVCVCVCVYSRSREVYLIRLLDILSNP